MLLPSNSINIVSELYSQRGSKFTSNLGGTTKIFVPSLVSAREGIFLFLSKLD